MLVHRAYRYELAPNNVQRTHLHQHAGTARFAYNWGLEQRIRLYEDPANHARWISAMEQHRALNKLKRTQYPWMYSVSKCAPQEALRDLEQAFKHFFRRLRRGTEKPGFPRFKKKGVNDSFRLTGTIRFIGHTIQLPRLGRIRLKEKRERYHRGRLLSVTVSRRADRWFVSVTVEEERAEPHPPVGEPVGVDLGVKVLATLSTGEVIHNPKALGKRIRRLRCLSRALSRKQRGSKNQRKARVRLARLHLRVFNIRQDILHKTTTFLTKSHSQIGIEELEVSGMLKNLRLARAIADVGFYEFRRQLEYKCRWYGSKLVIVPRWFPSSKRCSQCGQVKADLCLADRVYRCGACGFVIDRDLNAAINLLAVSCTESINACCEAGGNSPPVGPCLSMMQEPNTTFGMS